MATTDIITLGNLTKFKEKSDETYVSQTAFSGTVTTAVGGVAKGTVYTDANVVDILKAILSPYVASTIAFSSASPAFGVKEKGTTVTLSSATVSVTVGSEDVANHTITVTGGGNTYGSVAAGSVVSGSNTVTLSGSITEDQTLTATVNDGQSSKTATGSYSFVDPYYYGVVDDITTITGGTSLSSLTKLTQAKGSKTITVSPTSQYIVFAYPASYGTISSIKDSNNFENIGGFTYVTQSMTVTSGSVSYNIYYTSDVKTASSFKLTFAY